LLSIIVRKDVESEAKPQTIQPTGLTDGSISQGFGSFTTAMAPSELTGASRDGFWPVAGSNISAYVAFGVVLMLVGLAFEYGERLQRDTEGLV
jgi:hypothetical protein